MGMEKKPCCLLKFIYVYVDVYLEYVTSLLVINRGISKSSIQQWLRHIRRKGIIPFPMEIWEEQDGIVGINPTKNSCNGETMTN